MNWTKPSDLRLAIMQSINFRGFSVNKRTFISFMNAKSGVAILNYLYRTNFYIFNALYIHNRQVKG